MGRYSIWKEPVGRVRVSTYNFDVFEKELPFETWVRRSFELIRSSVHRCLFKMQKQSIIAQHNTSFESYLQSHQTRSFYFCRIPNPCCVCILFSTGVKRNRGCPKLLRTQVFSLIVVAVTSRFHTREIYLQATRSFCSKFFLFYSVRAPFLNFLVYWSSCSIILHCVRAS